MIRNYFKIAWRSLVNDKAYAVLNISGLAIGFTCFALIAIWIHDELSYDRFNKNYDRIFRVTSLVNNQNTNISQAVSPLPLAGALQNDFAEIENTVRLKPNDAILELNGQQFIEDKILATEPSFFEVFSYSLIKGNQQTALNDAYSIVLTESMSQKYFGKENPIGKAIKMYLYDPLGEGEFYTVTGIIPDAPKNAHFTFNCLVSFKSIEVARPNLMTSDGWLNRSFYTYLLLRDPSDRQKLALRLELFIKKYLPEQSTSSTHLVNLELQQLSDIHLNSNIAKEIETSGNKIYVFIFLTIGLFILMIAAINYMNLSTARSLNKAKEVGVKKVLGASKLQLIYQYLAESVFVALIGLGIALALVRFLKPIFIEFSEKDFISFLSPFMIGFLLIITVVIGLISGIYPAFFMTHYKTGDVLKGSFKTNPKGIKLRRGLVILQFTIAVILISSILIVDNQLNFMKFKDLGFNKEGLVNIKVNGNADVQRNYDTFKNSLKSKTQIQSVGRSNTNIIGGIDDVNIKVIDGQGNPIDIEIASLIIDSEYIDVYGMEIIHGRNFKPESMVDSTSFIINEVAMKTFGWKNHADVIGKPFVMDNRKGTVIGIIKDFNYDKLQHAIEPLVISKTSQNFSQITIKTDDSNVHLTMNEITEIWQQHFPGVLMEYSFIDQRLGNQYLTEERYSSFFLYFSVLAIFISCLGLIGLSAYSIQLRKKEIGIRKILGASAGKITLILSIDFIKLIFISILIGIPISWILMQNWLQNFVFRIDLGWRFFIKGSIITLSISILTIVFQTTKAALANPIKSIKTE